MKAVNTGEFHNPTPGAVSAVLTRVVDLGTSDSQYGPKRRVMLSWEIDENMQDGRPFMVNQFYTASFHQKARLRQDLEAWRGRAFADGDDFDLHDAIGKPCMLTIALNERGYADVKSLSPLPKGMQAIKPAGPTVAFDLDSPDWDEFDKLTDRLKERISETPEYAQAMGKSPTATAEQSQPRPGPEVESQLDPDDDIPF